MSSFYVFFFWPNQSPSSLDINPFTFQAERQRLPLEKGSTLVSISSGHLENREEPAMADASPGTDISTDVDTDDKNQRVMFCSPPLLICYFLPFHFEKFHYTILYILHRALIGWYQILRIMFHKCLWLPV